MSPVRRPRSSSPVHQIVPDCLGLLTTLAHRRRLVTLTSLAWTKTAPSALHDLSVRRTRSTALPPGSSTSTRNATRRSSSANCWRPRRSKRGRREPWGGTATGTGAGTGSGTEARGHEGDLGRGARPGVNGGTHENDVIPRGWTNSVERFATTAAEKEAGTGTGAVEGTGTRIPTPGRRLRSSSTRSSSPPRNGRRRRARRRLRRPRRLPPSTRLRRTTPMGPRWTPRRRR